MVKLKGAVAAGFSTVLGAPLTKPEMQGCASGPFIHGDTFKGELDFNPGEFG